jgi:hypothetical protein
MRPGIGSRRQALSVFAFSVAALAAIFVPGFAAASTGYSGSLKYPHSEGFPSGGDFEFSLSATKSRVGDFSFGYECSGSPASDTISGGVPLRHGTFKLNYTDHKEDPGFHVKIEGKISHGRATGTLRVLNDPDLGGACTSPTGHFVATPGISIEIP